MKTISAGLQWEFTRSTARIATCLRVERLDGSTYGFTTNRKSLVIGGLVYWPGSSFNPTDVASGSNLDTDNLTIEAFQETTGLSEDDVRVGRWDAAKFRTFQVNWADLTQGDRKLRAGTFGKVTMKDRTFVAELLGLANAYSTSLGQVTQQLCRNNFGDVKCGVSLVGSPTRTVTGTITRSLSDFFTLVDTARTEADAYFDEGTITIHYPDGDLRYEVKAYILVGDGGDPTWVTKTPIGFDATGVSYTMTQGCRRRFQEDCVATFANGKRFNGEPWLRGNDVLVQVGRHK